MRQFVTVLAFVGLAALPFPTRAAESFDACKYEITTLPVILTTQGVWCLKGDVATAMESGTAITIAANNITLDCNHFKIGGLNAGTATQATGIGGTSRSSFTLRHCNVRGFLNGLLTSGFIDPTIEDNIFGKSTYAGIYMAQGVGTMIRRNRVSDTGESTLPSVNGAVGIFAAEYADIVDNVVSGVRASAFEGDQPVTGIWTFNAMSATVTGNRVRDLAPKNAGVATGILHMNSWRTATVGNIVDTNGQPGSVGISCDSGNGMARDNTLLGTPTPVYGCQTMDNFFDVD